MLDKMKAWARAMQREIVAVWIAGRDPRVPWYAKGVALAVAAYALSPIDLVPDFIPLLGQLDELIVLPLGIMVAVKLIPPEIMAEHRAAAIVAEGQPQSRIAAAIIVTLWLAASLFLIRLFWPDPAV